LLADNIEAEDMERREWVDIRLRDKDSAGGPPLLRRVRWGASFVWRLRGLMFRSSIKPGDALLLVEPRQGRAAVSIHMFFVPFTIAAVWIDNSGRVVDKVAARPWRPYYAPREPARFTLETHPEFLDRVSIGDELVFEDSPSTTEPAGAVRSSADLR
jgi:uncharacterized membrane protein (UPF0127 family)